MDLLREIRNDIINDNVSISSVLRKARVLSSILKHKDFIEWIESELNGYADDDSNLPKYRIIYAESYGHFSGPFGKSGKNIPIPTLNLPDYVQEFTDVTRIVSGVKSLESVIKDREGRLVINWPANYIAACQTKIYQNMNLIGAWKSIGSCQIEQILDTIRNKLLNFVLNLQESYPESDTEDKISKIPQKDVNSIFNAHISGSYDSRKK